MKNSRLAHATAGLLCVGATAKFALNDLGISALLGSFAIIALGLTLAHFAVGRHGPRVAMRPAAYAAAIYVAFWLNFLIVIMAGGPESIGDGKVLLIVLCIMTALSSGALSLLAWIDGRVRDRTSREKERSSGDDQAGW